MGLEELWLGFTDVGEHLEDVFSDCFVHQKSVVGHLQDGRQELLEVLAVLWVDHFDEGAEGLHCGNFDVVVVGLKGLGEQAVEGWLVGDEDFALVGEDGGQDSEPALDAKQLIIYNKSKHEIE